MELVVKPDEPHLISPRIEREERRVHERAGLCAVGQLRLSAVKRIPAVAGH
jgi:hypothetical protein